MPTGARAQRPKEAEAAMARGAHLKQTVAASYIDAHKEKYTDEALAQKAHVSVNTVRNLWKGQNAELSTLLGVATAAGMSVVDLLVAMQGRPASASNDAVAAAIQEQTRMLERVLHRLVPPPPAEVESTVRPSEAAAWAEAEVDSLAPSSQRRRSGRRGAAEP